jgi:hypothetical protein
MAFAIIQAAGYKRSANTLQRRIRELEDKIRWYENNTYFRGLEEDWDWA